MVITCDYQQLLRSPAIHGEPATPGLQVRCIPWHTMEIHVCTQDRVLEDRGKTGAKGGFSVTNSDGSLVGPWNAMVCSPRIGGLAERMGSFCRHQNACAPDARTTLLRAVWASPGARVFEDPSIPGWLYPLDWSTNYIGRVYETRRVILVAY